MDDETKAALERSIQHWKNNTAAEMPDDVSVSDADCALCSLFLDLACHGCPIREKTGIPSCLGSPYTDCVIALGYWFHYGNSPSMDNFRKHAAQMVAFLESLREGPKE